jgi:hypothetical protein
VASKNRFDSHQEEAMKIALTTIAATAALAMALTAVPTTAARAQEQRRDDNVQQRQTTQVQHPDYSRNKYYTLGNREGYQDYGRKTQRPAHEHSYRNDSDRAAHDYGYQQGWQGTRGYHPDTDRH